MSIDVNSGFDLDDDFAVGSTGFGDTPLYLKDFSPIHPDVKTNKVGPKTIQAIDQPELGFPSFSSSITKTPAVSEKVGAVAYENGVSPSNRKNTLLAEGTNGPISLSESEEIPPVSQEEINSSFPSSNKKFSPSLALEALQAGLKREKFGTEKLHRHSNEIKQRLKSIDLLLDLNAELSSMGEGNSEELSPKSRQILDNLKANGIDLWPSNSKKISKEKLSELKSLASSQVDKCRTALQTIITTDIQPEINNLNAIMNAIQQMIQTDARTCKHANDNSTK